MGKIQIEGSCCKREAELVLLKFHLSVSFIASSLMHKK